MFIYAQWGCSSVSICTLLFFFSAYLWLNLKVCHVSNLVFARCSFVYFLRSPLSFLLFQERSIVICLLYLVLFLLCLVEYVVFVNVLLLF